jgi:Arabinose efflux permease
MPPPESSTSPLRSSTTPLQGATTPLQGSTPRLTGVTTASPAPGPTPDQIPPPDPGLIASLRGLDRDGRLLFAMRTARMFGYGFLAVVLVLYLVAVGLDPLTVGIVLTMTLIGDTVISLWLTTNADRLGRRRVLVAGAALMVLAGVVFAFTSWVPLLILAGAIGVLSPTGNEVGPFLAVEQAALSQTIHDVRRTATFAWYNLVGYVATATGALGAGLLSQALLNGGLAPVDAYRAIVIGYAVIGIGMAVGFWRLGPGIEAPPNDHANDGIRRRFGLHRSKKIVLRLSILFSIDAFGGGFIPQSLMAYWFHTQYGVQPAVLGAIFFAANLLAAVSSLSAARIAARFGLINTMVFTHIPSNVLLILVPIMPTLPLAVLMLLLRYSLSQMDVPTRQSYVMAVVDPDERSAAAGVTGVARTTGAAISPSLSSVMMASAGYAALPFYLAGSLKIVYDLLMYRDFRNVRPPEEQARR